MGCGTSAPDSKQPDSILYSNFIREIKEQVYSDHYLTGKLLGEGAYGAVFRCKHKQTGQLRAVKKISKAGLTKQEQQQRFVNDIKILQQLDHPNILTIFEYYQDEFFFYVISEYLDGGSLLDRIMRKKYFREQEAAMVIQQVLEAIIYCNVQKVAHRDIKLENLVLTAVQEDGVSDYKIKVIDWGCSQNFTPGQSMNQLIGTPLYIAPEVLAKKYNEQCDVWSIGVLVYIMLSGEAPFSGETTQEIMSAVKSQKFEYSDPIWDSASKEAKDFINETVIGQGKRLTAQKALEHPWLKKAQSNTMQHSLLPEEKKALGMSNFVKRHHIEQASRAFILKQVVQDAEKLKYEKLFKQYDTNQNGVLNKTELMVFFTENYEKEEVDKFQEIFNSIDINNNDQINQTEFISYVINKEVIQNELNLKQAFQLLDTDNNGYIAINEFKLMIGENQGDGQALQEMEDFIKDNDKDKDGKISFEEFKEIIVKCYKPQ